MEALRREVKELRESSKRKRHDSSDSESDSDICSSSDGKQSKKRRRSTRQQAQAAAMQEQIGKLQSIVAALPVLQAQPGGPAPRQTYPPQQQGYTVAPVQQGYLSAPQPSPLQSYVPNYAQPPQHSVAPPAGPRYYNPHRRGGYRNRRGGRQGRRSTRDKSHVECYRCHQMGHYASECSNTHAQRSSFAGSNLGQNDPVSRAAYTHGVTRQASSRHVPVAASVAYGHGIETPVATEASQLQVQRENVHPQRAQNILRPAASQLPQQAQSEQNAGASAQAAREQITSLQAALTRMQSEAANADAQLWSL